MRARGTPEAPEGVSGDAARDVIQLAPPHRCKRTVLSGSQSNLRRAGIIRSTRLERVDRLCRMLERLIYLDNQLWEHENHRLVIEELRRMPQVEVSYTGVGFDCRGAGSLRLAACARP